MTGSFLFITGWVLVLGSITILLRYRLLLRHFEQHLARLAPGHQTPLDTSLKNRMTLIDRWGISLTIGMILYTILFPIYLLYRSFEQIAQDLLRLLSYI